MAAGASNSRAAIARLMGDLKELTMNPCEVLPIDSIILLTHCPAPTQRPVQTPLRLAAGGTQLLFALTGLQCGAAERRQPPRVGGQPLWAGRYPVGRWATLLAHCSRRPQPSETPVATLHRCHSGGIFSMRIFFHEDYPAKPPKVRFTCEMYHPNGALISFNAFAADPSATACSIHRWCSVSRHNPGPVEAHLHRR